MTSFFEEGDPVAAEGQGLAVHIIWTDSMYGSRICRPSMTRKAGRPDDVARWHKVGVCRDLRATGK